MWHGSLHVVWVFVQAIAQHTKKAFTFSPTHKKQKNNNNETKNPKNGIERAKRRKKKTIEKNRDK